MFIPNAYCYIRRKTGTYDKYGQPAFGDKEKVPFALVRYDTMVEDSTVRADSSATRGNIKEFTASGRVLFPVSVKPTWGDILVIYGKVYLVKQLEPRYSVLGILDHYQCDLEKYEDNFGDED